MIISSYGFNTPITKAKFQKTIDTKDKRILIIPCAGHNNRITGNYEKNGAVNLGFSPENVIVFDKDRANYYSNLDIDYLYVVGGDTFKLLHELKESGFDKAIVEYVKSGVEYIGVSAGAYIATNDIEYVKLLEDNNYITDGDFSALGLFSNPIICHYDSYSYGDIKSVLDHLNTNNRLYVSNKDVLII